jgi:hypothetical protein
MKTTGLVLMAVIVAGCSAVQSPPAQPLEPASLTPIVQPQRTVIPPDPLDSLPLAVRAAYQSGRNTPVRDGFAIFYPYNEHSEPIIHVSPLHVTEIGCWVVTEQKTHLSGHVPRDFGDLLDKVSLN